VFVFESQRHTDHLGEEHPSLKAMCEHYGISMSLYLNRRYNGASKRDALTLPIRRKRYYKYKGHIFKNKEGLLAYAGLMPTEYWFIEKDVVVI